MPRKTKKQKQKIKGGKTTIKVSPALSTSSKQLKVKKDSKKSRSAQSSSYIDLALYDKQKALVVRDLRKTMVLSALAIGALVVISLVPTS